MNDKKTMVPVGPHHVEVSDPHNVPVVVADIYTEVRIVNGLVAVSFASMAADGDGVAKAQVNARVRFPPTMFVDLAQKVALLLANTDKVPKA